ncbi:MAG TPA: transglycosylase SLT domain-containing protein [Burkholderiales bacterium]|nr:transglycosylase SLT domain-containing protein [Burkholderiales bacterium]
MARGMFAAVGMAVVLVLSLPAPRGHLMTQLAQLARPAVAMVSAEAAGVPELPAASATAETVAVSQTQAAPTRDQRVLAESIARRYRVAESASQEYVTSAYRVGREYAVDPLLILAVMAIESRYNPVAQSSMGARGLMQVIPRFHPEKLIDHGGDDDALLDPEVNIRVGTWVLHEYLRQLGDVESALQKYAGALDDPSSPYAGKVLTEKARLQQILARSRREA